tara:strand:+ start:2076 stop:2495 length:420 start_codon:yes stop_codon:yes gene_type:complete
MYDLTKAKESILNPQSIIDVVARSYNISEKKLTEPTRKREIVTLRKYASYLLIKYNNKKKTLLELSKYLGYSSEGSHATILFHFRDTKKKMTVYEDMRLDIEKLEKAIERFVDTSLKMGSFTVQDAIDNPKILDMFKKK